MEGGKMEMPESFDRGALTEATFLILLSLYEPRHGYGVMQHIASVTNKRVNLGAGTLYGALNLLQEKGWIAVYGGSERKKSYYVTPEGQCAVDNEVLRLYELVNIAKDTFEGWSQVSVHGNGPRPDKKAPTHSDWRNWNGNA
jgi:DNA-binding PadR family transcriptional regulator